MVMFVTLYVHRIRLCFSHCDNMVKFVIVQWSGYVRQIVRIGYLHHIMTTGYLCHIAMTRFVCHIDDDEDIVAMGLCSSHCNDKRYK
jgi:hypothetical protein